MKTVAYEFLHPNGHAIVDYSEHTHVGDLTAEKGYTKHPLVYASEALPSPIHLPGIQPAIFAALVSWHEIQGIPAEPEDLDKLAGFLAAAVIESPSADGVKVAAPTPAFWESGGDWTDDPDVAEGWMLEVEAGTRSGVTPLYTHPSGVDAHPAPQPVAWVPIHPRSGPLWSMTTDKPNPERLPSSYPLRPLVFADGVPGRGEGQPDA